MVLYWRRYGRVGGCRIKKEKTTQKSVLYRTDIFQWAKIKARPVLKNVLTYFSRVVLFHITGFYQWLVDSSLSSLLMTDKISVRYVPWKPHIEEKIESTLPEWKGRKRRRQISRHPRPYRKIRNQETTKNQEHNAICFRWVASTRRRKSTG